MADLISGNLSGDQIRTAIRRARKDAGLSQAEVGKKTGIAQSKLSGYESGQLELTKSEIDLVWGAIKSSFPPEFGHIPKNIYEKTLPLHLFLGYDSAISAAELLKQSKISQEKLAARAGLTRGQVRGWIKGGDYRLTFAERGRLYEAIYQIEEERAGRRLSPESAAKIREKANAILGKYKELQDSPPPPNQLQMLAELIKSPEVRLAQELEDARKIIATQDKLISKCMEALDIYAQTENEKDSEIAGLKIRIAELRDLLDLETQASLNRSKADELREKLIKKEE